MIEWVKALVAWAIAVAVVIGLAAVGWVLIHN